MKGFPTEDGTFCEHLWHADKFFPSIWHWPSWKQTWWCTELGVELLGISQFVLYIRKSFNNRETNITARHYQHQVLHWVEKATVRTFILANNEHGACHALRATMVCSASHIIKAAQFQPCLVHSRSMDKQDCYPNPNHNLLIQEKAVTVWGCVCEFNMPTGCWLTLL